LILLANNFPITPGVISNEVINIIPIILAEITIVIEVIIKKDKLIKSTGTLNILLNL
jgi:hypothetical protein